LNQAQRSACAKRISPQMEKYIVDQMMADVPFTVISQKTGFSRTSLHKLWNRVVASHNRPMRGSPEAEAQAQAKPETQPQS